MAVQITNLNDLSSDYHLVLIVLNGSPISSSSPSAKKSINWCKYKSILSNSPMDINSSTKDTTEIDHAVDSFTSVILDAVRNSSMTPNPGRPVKCLPTHIMIEIKIKNRFRREWQQNRDPATKNCLNAKISLIRTLLSTHKQNEWDPPTFRTKRTYFLTGRENRNHGRFHRITIHPGPVLQEFNNYIEKTLSSRSTEVPGHNLYTTPGVILKLFTNLPKKKVPSEDQISNTALRLLPKNMILALTKILNVCIRLRFFPTKRAIIICIAKPGKDPQIPDSFLHL